MKQLVSLLLLLAALSGVGGWNYHRNLQEEQAEPRPLGGLSDAELQALSEAYEQEIELWTRRFEQISGRRVNAHDRAYLGEQIQEFERVQGLSSRSREVARELARRQAALERVRAEERVRESERDRLALHWRRLVSF